MTDSLLARALRPRRAWCVGLGCVACAGCVQMCGFEEGRFTPDVSVDALPNEPDAAGGEPDAAGGEPDAAEGEPEPPVTCDVYCKKVTEVCSGANAVYPAGQGERALTHCSALCLHYGAEGVQCRYGQLSNLEALGGDIRERCSAAGPTGWSPDENARCAPSVCASYCELMRSECPTTGLAERSDAGPTASDEAACLDVCLALPPSPGDSEAYGPLLNGVEVMGNNVACRLLHIGNAAVEMVPSGAASIHCEHAAGRGLFCTPSSAANER